MERPYSEPVGSEPNLDGAVAADVGEYYPNLLSGLHWMLWPGPLLSHNEIIRLPRIQCRIG